MRSSFLFDSNAIYEICHICGLFSNCFFFSSSLWGCYVNVNSKGKKLRKEKKNSCFRNKRKTHNKCEMAISDIDNQAKLSTNQKMIGTKWVLKAAAKQNEQKLTKTMTAMMAMRIWHISVTICFYISIFRCMSVPLKYVWLFRRDIFFFFFIFYIKWKNLWREECRKTPTVKWELWHKRPFSV